MVKSNNKIYSLLIGSIVIFSLISLACGASTAQQLASAVPPTAVTGQGSIFTPTSEKPQAKQATPTKEIKSSPSPIPEPIGLITQGLGQSGQELGYGFVIKNPNSNYAYEDSEYQIAIYNSEGTVVETDSGYISLILPNQQLGIGGTIYLSEGIIAANIKVQINAGRTTVSDLSDTFTTDKVTYIPNENFPTVRALITNPYSKDITDIRVSVILLNEASEIIGGGFTYLNFVNANSSTGVSISVTSNGNVSRAEIYPTLSGLSILETSSQLPEGANNLILSKQGYGQSGSELGFGLILDNPNQGFAIDGTMYHLTAYAEDGTVLGVSEGYVDLLLPNQTFGIANDIYLEKGVTVARIDAQIKSGNFSTSETLPTFTAENATFLPDQYFPKVTGEIISPYDKDITNLRVSAIAYNEAGDIIGSGYTYLDFVPANSKSAVSVTITVSGTPASVKLFATITSLSDIQK
jgi:hypothetical protein